MPAETVVFDACAVIAMLQGEPGADKTAHLLNEPSRRCLIHVVNLCEVWYDTLRRDPEEDAGDLETLLRGSGLEIYPTAPSAVLWESAGRLKATRRLSLADCFALALTLHEQGTLVTTDHHEFDPIAASGLCPIQFIR